MYHSWVTWLFNLFWWFMNWWYGERTVGGWRIGHWESGGSWFNHQWSLVELIIWQHPAWVQKVAGGLLNRIYLVRCLLELSHFSYNMSNLEVFSQKKSDKIIKYCLVHHSHLGKVKKTWLCKITRSFFYVSQVGKINTKIWYTRGIASEIIFSNSILKIFKRNICGFQRT